MKLIRKLKSTAVIILVLLGIYLVRQQFFGAPSEAQMKAQLSQNKADFEQLRTMLQHDSKVSSIAIDWVSGEDKGLPIEDPQKMGLSSQRLALYRSLMKKLNISPLYRVSESGNYLRFVVFGGGFTDTTWSVGYVWSAKTPENMVPSAYNAFVGRDKIVHSEIEAEDHWYIYQRH